MAEVQTETAYTFYREEIYEQERLWEDYLSDIILCTYCCCGTAHATNYGNNCSRKVRSFGGQMFHYTTAERHRTYCVSNYTHPSWLKWSSFERFHLNGKGNMFNEGKENTFPFLAAAAAAVRLSWKVTVHAACPAVSQSLHTLIGCEHETSVRFWFNGQRYECLPNWLCCLHSALYAIGTGGLLLTN
jgi:hypothetical protein